MLGWGRGGAADRSSSGWMVHRWRGRGLARSCLATSTLTTHCTQHITYDTHITPNTDCPNFSQFITHLYYCGWGHSNKHWTFESCFYCFRLHQTDFYKHFWQLRFLLARIDMTWGLFHEDNRYPSSASIAMASTMWPGNSQCGVRRGDKQAAAGGGHHGTTLCLYYQQIRNHG